MTMLDAKFHYENINIRKERLNALEATLKMLEKDLDEFNYSVELIYDENTINIFVQSKMPKTAKQLNNVKGIYDYLRDHYMSYGELSYSTNLIVKNFSTVNNDVIIKFNYSFDTVGPFVEYLLG